MSRVLSDAAVREYHDRGFVVARGLFDRDEIALVNLFLKSTFLCSS